MDRPNDLASFEAAVLSHLDAAYNLARWLVRDDHDAEDVVQEACLRALRFSSTFRGGDLRAWLLAIVRNTGHTWLRQKQLHAPVANVADLEDEADDAAADPEFLFLRDCDRQLVRQALEELPVEFREALVLRELEGLSYKEVAVVAGVPIGTVMSRLARARRLLQERLRAHIGEDA